MCLLLQIANWSVTFERSFSSLSLCSRSAAMSDNTAELAEVAVTHGRSLVRLYASRDGEVRSAEAEATGNVSTTTKHANNKACK